MYSYTVVSPYLIQSYYHDNIEMELPRAINDLLEDEGCDAIRQFKEKCDQQIEIEYEKNNLAMRSECDEKPPSTEEQMNFINAEYQNAQEKLRLFSQRENEKKNFTKVLNDWVSQGGRARIQIGEKLAKVYNERLETLELNISVSDLPDVFDKLTSLKRIRISFGNLGNDDVSFTGLPESMSALVNLVELSVSGKRMAEVPIWIENLISLEKLELSRCCIRKLPDSIGNLTNLKELYLKDTDLEELPASIGNLTNLKKLYIRYNGINELPESIGNLTNLKKLYIECTQIEELPQSVGNLKKLELLKINYCDCLFIIPESIGDLENLKLLDLSGWALCDEFVEKHLEFAKNDYLNDYSDYVDDLSDGEERQSLHEYLMNLFTSSLLPDSVSRLTQLEKLFLNHSAVKQSDIDKFNLSESAQVYSIGRQEARRAYEKMVDRVVATCTADLDANTDIGDYREEDSIDISQHEDTL